MTSTHWAPRAYRLVTRPPDLQDIVHQRVESVIRPRISGERKIAFPLVGQLCSSFGATPELGTVAIFPGGRIVCKAKVARRLPRRRSRSPQKCGGSG